VKCDVGHSHFDLGSYDRSRARESRYSHLLPQRSKALSLGKLPLLSHTPTHPRHYYSHSHAPIAKLGAGVRWTNEREKGEPMHKDELHGFVVKRCSDAQLDAAINRHLNGHRCSDCNQPVGALLVSLGKSSNYDCN
jgi:hypothetical protein